MAQVDYTISKAPSLDESDLRIAPDGLDRDTMALWRAIDSLDNELGNDFVSALLTECIVVTSDGERPADVPHSVRPVDNSKVQVPRPWKGVTPEPHYRILLRELLLWGGSGVFPLSFATGPLLPCCVTNDDGEFANEEPTHDAAAASLRLAVARAARERSPEAFRTALEKIGPAGIGRLLGLRTTAGSVTGALPAGREALATAARARVGKKKGAKLSVSARALAKHCGRRPSGWGTCYWGDENVVMFGGDEERNARAEAVVNVILDEAVWMNVHHAPGGTRVLELRVESGHGARWHAADAAFRGFLEPHSRELATKKKEERRNRALVEQGADAKKNGLENGGPKTEAQDAYKQNGSTNGVVADNSELTGGGKDNDEKKNGQVNGETKTKVQDANKQNGNANGVAAENSELIVGNKEDPASVQAK